MHQTCCHNLNLVECERASDLPSSQPVRKSHKYARPYSRDPGSQSRSTTGDPPEVSAGRGGTEDIWESGEIPSMRVRATPSDRLRKWVSWWSLSRINDWSEGMSVRVNSEWMSEWVVSGGPRPLAHVWLSRWKMLMGGTALNLTACSHSHPAHSGNM